MTKGVKFRSIFYRYVLFIIVLFFLGFNQIVGRGFQTITFYDYAFSFDQTQLVYFLLLLLLLGIGIHFLFPWKFYITQDGIYLRRSDLFVPWSDISGVSHVWINKRSNFGRGLIFYNHKWRVQNGLLQDRADIVKGFPVRQIIIWKRKGGINFNPGYFLPTYEVIYLICKKPFKLAKGANSFGDIWEFTQDMNNEHPAPFPLELAKRVVQSTNAQIVLDPFMGSGTTAIAAALLDRKFIGIELSPEYVKISKKRYNNIFGNLFGVDMKTFTKESLIQELKEIKNKGPVLNNRGSNNGASGNVLEDLLGIEENNLPLANAAEWEIKTKKRSSNSLVTLFHVEPSPTACKFVPNILLPKYGWKHKEAGKKYPDTEKSFRQTIKCGLFSDRGFSIKLNDTEEKIEVNFRYDLIDQKHNEWKQDISTFQTLDTIPYWGFNDIYHKLGAKLHNCFFAIVDVCKRGDDEYFTYSEIYMLRNLSKDKFISAIRDGKIYIDFDARTGHNHGTKFRIKEKDIFDLYEECIEISNL